MLGYGVKCQVNFSPLRGDATLSSFYSLIQRYTSSSAVCVT